MPTRFGKLLITLACLATVGGADAAPVAPTQPPLDEIQRSVRDAIRRRGFWCAGNVSIERPQGNDGTQAVRVICGDADQQASYDVRIDASHLDVREVWDDR
ncbi:hypothetical protein [Aureimonas sp. ME7]|uniref:hypothetical protein n=1 Tax=Aureimonas sp. ME7 TaxID=2744252 RepID=UPI0015F759F1|nr:hypothetical protein [Aureimonas sp. ME7]